MGYYKTRKRPINKNAMAAMNKRMSDNFNKENNIQPLSIIKRKKIDKFKVVEFYVSTKLSFVDKFINSSAFVYLGIGTNSKLIKIMAKVDFHCSYPGTLETPPEDESFEVDSLHCADLDISNFLEDSDWEYIDKRVQKYFDNSQS